MCYHGYGELGTLVHIWWTCPIVRLFWLDLFRMASTLHSQNLEPDPATAPLNHYALDLTRVQTKLLQKLMTASKQTIARAWKTTTLCTLETKNRMTQAMIHSKIEATILDRIPKHRKVWQPWVDHFLPPGFDSSLLEP